MTVEELIHWLQQFPPDAKIAAGVLSEGQAAPITVVGGGERDWSSVELFKDDPHDSVYVDDVAKEIIDKLSVLEEG